MHFAWGRNSNGQTSLPRNQSNNNIIWQPTIIEPFGKNVYIEKICGEANSTCFINEDHKIKHLQNFKMTDLEGLEPIEQIDSGSSFFLAKSFNGTLYSWGNNGYNQLGLKDKSNQNPQKIPFFEKISIESICCGVLTSYVVTSDHKLFSFGYNSFGQRGNGNKNQDDEISEICAGIKKVFSGNDSHFFFAEKLNGEFFACGRNDYGQLGIGKISNGEPKLVKNGFLSKQNVIQLETSYYHSLVLIKGSENNRVFTVGSNRQNGLNKKLTEFQEIQSLFEKEIISISCGSSHSLALSRDNKIYIWGTSSGFGELGFSQNTLFLSSPTEIELPGFISQGEICIECSALGSFVYTKRISSLLNDMHNLFHRHELCDSEIVPIGQNTPISYHSLILQNRIGIEKVDHLKNILKDKTKESIIDFFDWVYSGKLQGKTSDILISLGFSEIQIEDSIGYFGVLKSISNLYSKNESKDFVIISENSEIPVHSIILLARTDLFRGMFINVNDQSHRVHDYSKRSSKVIQKFIEFLYHDQFISEITKKEKKELSDAHEFYQISDSTFYENELEKAYKRK
ncbi:regulator of chromosome condensation [Anaeramoeba ignava]|uniref:Regulator of chromosome condensation n=1 Tax=Anaeramoeba ignava TaxID=1746090 RepID=A0A9Q0RH05_ANAIG|nr:regulator of chromosome condensation [Anaeramoeba ignava]